MHVLHDGIADGDIRGALAVDSLIGRRRIRDDSD